MNHLGLFEGIGGFSLAARWMNWNTVAWCEINEFCQKVLKYHFPKAIPHGDIKTTDFSVYRGLVDIVTGGFPCQPYSMAGNRKGKEDDRHLWPQTIRAVGEIQPSWFVGENVLGITNWMRGMVFHEIQTDLESAGYEVLPVLNLPACGKNAPHKRERVWFVAHAKNKNGGLRIGKETEYAEHRINGFDGDASNSNYNGQQSKFCKHEIITDEGRFEALNDTKPLVNSDPTIKGLEGGGGRPSKRDGLAKHSKQNAAHANSNKRPERGLHKDEQEKAKRHAGSFDARSYPSHAWDNFPIEPPLCSGNDGLSGRLAGITFSKHRAESIKGYGNSIVPQVAYEIFKAIEYVNNIEVDKPTI